MFNHNGYFKQNGFYYVQNEHGAWVKVSAVKIAQLEMIRKDGFKC